MTPAQKKIALVAVLLAGAAGIYLILGPSESAVSPKPSFVCVETGQVFQIAQDAVPSFLPGKNPKTGHLTLLPARKADDGKLYVGARYASELQNPELARVNKYVDPNTLEVLKSPQP
jgi:hypothetical protein